VLAATLQLVLRRGFRQVTIDLVAQRTGVAKTSIYRRWPNKAAMVMDAFLQQVEAETAFPERARAIDSLQAQLALQARLFRSALGGPIRALLAEAQFDPAVAAAFHDRWIMPRRRRLQGVVEQAMREGDLRPDLDVAAAMDGLYGPLYYRLMVSREPLDDAYPDRLFAQVCAGLGGRADRK